MHAFSVTTFYEDVNLMHKLLQAGCSGVAYNHTSSGDTCGGIKCHVGLSFPADQCVPNQSEPVNVPWLAMFRTAPNLPPRRHGRLLQPRLVQ
jgi:hypothetical protein